MGRVSILLIALGKVVVVVATLTFFTLAFPLAFGRYFGSGVAIIILLLILINLLYGFLQKKVIEKSITL